MSDTSGSGSGFVEAEIARAGQEFADLGARISAHVGATGRVSGRAYSPDGAITITAAPGGRLLDVEIENSALSMPPERLAAALVQVAGQAARDANSRMHQAMRTVVGPDTRRGLTDLGMAAGEADDPDPRWQTVLRRS